MNPADPRSLVMMRKILDVLKSSNQYEVVFHQIIESLERLYRCQTCAIILIDPRTEYLKIENSFGVSLTYRKSYHRKISTGAVGDLFWTGKPIFIGNAAEFPEATKELTLEQPFGSCACVQIAVSHRTLGYLHVDSRSPEGFEQSDIGILQAFADFAGLAYQKWRLVEENMRLDRIDHETGLEKYASFLERLGESVERARNFGEHFAILIGDVDNFKEIAHTYGYDSSRQLLAEMGQLLRDTVRPVDATGRFGYDEFIILRTNSHLDEAIRFAKDLGKNVAQTAFTDKQINSTLSIAVATFPENGRTIDDLVLTAKKALLEAQRSGRGSVFHFPNVWYASEVALRDTNAH
jgi:diguanylate cyclase (GGDEF)-like protein